MLDTDKETIKERIKLVARSLKKVDKGKIKLAIGIIKSLNFFLKEEDPSLKKTEIMSQANNLKTFFPTPNHFDSIEEIANSPYLALEDLVQRASK
jgi:hypothetical protein